MSIVHVMDHPLIQHKLSLMRDQETGPKEFRELLNEISMLMAYEVTRDLPLKTVEIETPICRAQTKVIAGKKLAIVPILRAGLGMVDGIMSLVPAAKIGHIGLYRDPNTLEPVEYYCKLPADAQEREILLVDPMLATGGSAAAAIGFLKKRGCKNIKLVNLIAAPEGIARVQAEHPDPANESRAPFGPPPPTLRHGRLPELDFLPKQKGRDWRREPLAHLLGQSGAPGTFPR